MSKTTKALAITLARLSTHPGLPREHADDRQDMKDAARLLHPEDGRALVAKAEAAGSRMWMQQAWLDGTTETADGEEVTFDLTCGAGLGGTQMVLRVLVDGVTVAREVISMRDVVIGWVEGILADHAAGALPADPYRDAPKEA